MKSIIIEELKFREWKKGYEQLENTFLYYGSKIEMRDT